MMIKTDLKLLEEVLKGDRKEICCIYGEPATGKTTLVKEAAIFQSRKGKKIVFIDAEKSFSVERVLQLSDDEKVLRNIFVIKPKNLEDQTNQLKNLLKLKELDLVIVDTIGIYHRLELKKGVLNANNELHKQFNILSELCSKGKSVLITNQVYRDIESDRIKAVGGNMFKNWSKCLLRLEKEPRKLILEKPEKKEVGFEIANEGLLGK